MKNSELIEKLKCDRNLSDDEFKVLLESDAFDEYLYRAADEKRRSIYGDEVYIRGLIEFTNYCHNNCYYCGIRRDNKKLSVIGLQKKRYSPVVRKDTVWVFAPLFCKAERIAIIPILCYVILFLKFMSVFQIVLLHFLLVRNQKKVIVTFLMKEQHVIYCVTKRQMQNIIKDSIHTV